MTEEDLNINLPLKLKVNLSQKAQLMREKPASS